MKAALAGIAVAALVLAGCGDSDTPPVEAPATSAQQSQTEDQAASETTALAECATDCLDEYSAALEDLEACDTFGDAEGCDDAVQTLKALHQPILDAHPSLKVVVGAVDEAIASWDDDECATETTCTLQWVDITVEAKQLRLDLAQL